LIVSGVLIALLLLNIRLIKLIIKSLFKYVGFAVGAAPSLDVKKRFYLVLVDLCNQACVGEIAFLLFGLFSENVAVESVFSLDFS
jgi:hypothetical protein